LEKYYKFFQKSGKIPKFQKNFKNILKIEKYFYFPPNSPKISKLDQF